MLLNLYGLCSRFKLFWMASEVVELFSFYCFLNLTPIDSDVY